MIKPKAYSYLRFSTPEQAKGDSARRQIAGAETYAALHNLDLDRTFKLRDEGISAYHGANEETGRLGDFLEAVRHGDISVGSYLLVESLDRLSRMTPRKAVRLLENICEAGIIVVTLFDNRVWTHDAFDKDPLPMILALMVAQRAHEESATKARRLKQAWEGKRLKMATAPLTAICPGWLRLSNDRSRYEVISERADVVRSIFDMYLRGLGQHAIASDLNTRRIAPFGRSELWHRSYVKKILENPAVIGRFTPHTQDTVARRKVRTALETLEGYFPPIIDAETFERVSAMSGSRGARQSAGVGKVAHVANILSGLAKCPACGTTMTRVNKGGAKGGKPFLVCSKAKVGAGCDYRQVKLEFIERSVISLGTYLHDLIPSPDVEIEERYRTVRMQVEEVEFQIQNLVQSVASGRGSKAVLRGIEEREALLPKLRLEEAELASRAAALITNRIGNTVDEFRVLTTVEPESLDLAKVNAVLRQLFDAVVIDYDTGFLRLQWRHMDEAEVKVFYAMV
ncbi:recombinase family protein [Rhizobium sp. VS19-DR104.2]|uniref:recombinase family protein n=1 Tax=unclassified Rhizobium TaxID=2613769 RepID=UPI001CC72577|nr:MULTISPECIES: recombinase family protein [unclassified Rhizobium]MBZ5759687.1 recombinase family protein [Rhizobium sp. VS19-DR96]MBZ5766075.1 recombinase family protein [Rhizobium sp. VS19-DR129.2]MBZ5772858.1 recombinase family protein [Rhizobium sp. VS19-DRK62.2]MBZ5786598.1 recombinase family protein [Rhizobium sp. VS19-DR121]MBZ5804378.1 recombinase family protein [Rhizobium sp. VS19-DR181]